MNAWQLSSAVNLRAEVFGGMAFHRQRGATLELDAEAYQLLCAYREPCALPLPGHPAARLMPQLVRLGFLQPAPVDPGQAVALSREGERSGAPEGDGLTLSAPETIHLAITARCNQACTGCYVPRAMRRNAEWTVAELQAWPGMTLTACSKPTCFGCMTF